MAEPSDSSLAFFTKGTAKQWAFLYRMRDAAIKVKADERKSSKKGPEEFIKLDTWVREKVPSLIKSRKEFHILYDELVQIAKWRLMMGKYRPKLLDLVRINTESAVTGVSRKSFKKISAQKNLQQALTMLVNLKGIGPSTASAILAAAFPEEAPFMSDEGMLSTPGVEATDSTIAEYINYSDALRNKTQWLQQRDPEFKWNIHMVDQVLWIYYTVKDLKPQLLEAMPRGEDEVVSTSLSGGPSSDAVDDNANDCTSSNEDSVPVNGNYYSNHPNVGSSNNNNNSNSYNHHADSNSESASVPYSEEELSQGGEASCSSSVGVDLSMHHHRLSSSNSNSVNGHYSPVGAVSSTSPMNGSANKRSVHEMHESEVSASNNHTTTNGAGSNEDSSSKDGLLDSEDSRDGGSGARLTMMLMTSEENSIDGVVVSGVTECRTLTMVAHDEEPALKKQKTLELSAALTAEAE